MNKRPTTLPVHVRLPSFDSNEMETLNLEDGSWELKSFSYDEHPTMLMLPVLKPPGIVRRVVTPENIVVADWFHIDPIDRNKIKTAYLVSMLFNLDIFLRLLAKIAHGFAVFRFGVGGFEPLLPQLILQRNPAQLRYLIGGANHRPFVDGPYEVAVGISKFPVMQDYVVCSIKLFASLNSPTYSVIVGKKLHDPLPFSPYGRVYGK